MLQFHGLLMCLMSYSTTICKWVGIIPVPHHWNCRIPDKFSAKTVSVLILPCHCNVIKAIIRTVCCQWSFNYDLTKQCSPPHIRSILKLAKFCTDLSFTNPLTHWPQRHCDKKILYNHFGTLGFMLTDWRNIMGLKKPSNTFKWCRGYLILKLIRLIVVSMARNPINECDRQITSWFRSSYG